MGDILRLLTAKVYEFPLFCFKDPLLLNDLIVNTGLTKPYVVLGTGLGNSGTIGGFVDIFGFVFGTYGKLSKFSNSTLELAVYCELLSS